MEYQVILEDFQGPLDLLLHLIKEKEMDLQTLELSVITCLLYTSDAADEL